MLIGTVIPGPVPRWGCFATPPPLPGYLPVPFSPLHLGKRELRNILLCNSPTLRNLSPHHCFIAGAGPASEKEFV